jgi:hypothetical protein
LSLTACSWLPLFPDESRFSLLDEGLDAFTRIRRSRDCRKCLRLFLELAFERSIGCLGKQAFDRAKRLRRTRGKLFRYSRSLGLHIAIRNNEIYKTERQRRPGIERLAEQEEAPRARNPIRRVIVVVDPLSGLNPILENAAEIRADSAITTRSAAAIRDTLPPATLP